ncbi:MAG: histidine kinase, partial [Lachnospiraceae bacterium]|nr:histidine kinase [Lachnospiraceae bacterium]
ILFWALAMILDDGIYILYMHSLLTRREILTFLSLGVFPIAAFVLQYIFPGLKLIFVAALLCFIIFFMEIHVQQAAVLQEKERQLEKMNLSIIVSQLQPHFLYNALTNIRVLTTQDPSAAKEAIGNFSRYLRGNMESLTNMEPIHFEQELEHIKTYLALEGMRFDDKFTVEYNIEESDFFIPALSIQPLVENAVKHGVGMLKGKGKIIISSYSDELNFYITIEDDGVGFDVNELRKRTQEIENEKNTLGLFAIKHRLYDMVRGSVQIQSNIGSGTKVTVTVPRA